jgi:hypothetical protein
MQNLLCWQPVTMRYRIRKRRPQSIDVGLLHELVASYGFQSLLVTSQQKLGYSRFDPKTTKRRAHNGEREINYYKVHNNPTSYELC